MNTSSKRAGAGAIVFSMLMLFFPFRIWAQDTESNERAAMIAAAKEIMDQAPYCALITLDSAGHPQVRTMDPLSPSKDMIVWLGTNKNSRKVGEIRRDPRVSLYYEAPEGGGYAVVKGLAELVDDPGKIEKHWKPEWDEHYPEKQSTFMLIKVVPLKLEVVYYKQGIVGSSKTWAVPYVEF